MNIKTTFLLNRPGLFEVDVTYKPNTDPSTPDTAPWGGRGASAFLVASRLSSPRPLSQGAHCCQPRVRGQGPKRSPQHVPETERLLLRRRLCHGPGRPPRVWAGGVTAQRAHPGRRRGGAVKSAISVKGSESRGACRRKPAPGCCRGGGGRCQLSLREQLSCCVAVSVLSEFCFFFNCDDWEVSPTHGLRGDRMLLRLRSAAGACYRCGLSGWTGKGATGQSKREAQT